MADGVESINLASQSSEVGCNPKLAFHFLAEERWWVGLKPIDQPGRSSEVE